MIPLLVFGALLAPIAAAQTIAQIDPALVGTWTTKSRKVLTGPGFYDPVNDRITEPDLPGISYSFTADGHYEEAYYRANSNPQNPDCPKGVIQWQHGTFVQNTNGSLSLSPIKVDGRQLISDPCTYDQSVYTRYHQAEFFKSLEILKDPYHGVQRLNLYQFDGAPMNAMYLAYTPPQMLPTQTLNPTSSASKTGQATATASSSAKHKRDVPDEFSPPLNARALVKPRTEILDPDKWWWFGVGATLLGGAAYMIF